MTKRGRTNWTKLGVWQLVLCAVCGTAYGFAYYYAGGQSGAWADRESQSGSHVVYWNTFLIVAVILFFTGVMTFIIPILNRWNDAFFSAADTALRPVPSVQEINQTLSNYYGRPASIEEVAAAQSIFARNRNEAAAQTALGVGAFLLFTHRL